MKHHVSVYCTRNGSLLVNLSRVFDDKVSADTYAAQVRKQYGSSVTIL